VVSLTVIIGTRSYLSVDAFNEWGWRIPFIISFLLMAIAIFEAKGQAATKPWREAFLSRNIRSAVIASIVVLGQGCVWYSGQFWVFYFLQTVKKLDVLPSSYVVRIALLIATPALRAPAWSVAEWDRPSTWHKYQRLPGSNTNALTRDAFRNLKESAT